MYIACERDTNVQLSCQTMTVCSNPWYIMLDLQLGCCPQVVADPLQEEESEGEGESALPVPPVARLAILVSMSPRAKVTQTLIDESTS